ncbi:hypothetical protein [Crocosphaera sp.]|uniref:hypothetical protein n=1 Tax=Crocosphaera sp. TaxID=2729996 RepID=UPI003F29683E|nr:hypothetical protein [Crocosphaera sp.]
MTSSNDNSDFVRDTNRRLRELSWRIERLELSQMPARSLNEAFDRVYEEIDILENKVDNLRDEMREGFNALDAKFELLMKHITGQQ